MKPFMLPCQLLGHPKMKVIDSQNSIEGFTQTFCTLAMYPIADPISKPAGQCNPGTAIRSQAPSVQNGDQCVDGWMGVCARLVRSVEDWRVVVFPSLPL